MVGITSIPCRQDLMRGRLLFMHRTNQSWKVIGKYYELQVSGQKLPIYYIEYIDYLLY